LRGKGVRAILRSGGTMPSSRRRLLLLSFAAVPAVLVPFQDAPVQETGRNRRRPDVPDDPSNGSNAGTFPGNASKAMLEERQKNIRKNVDKLYELAAQLKAEVEKTDSTTVLSVGMLKKAEEIEKLAKQIKDHAKG
jgi:hypothetical protein